jgi:hypothetical protein
MAYAETTTVPVAKTKAEIEALVMKKGGKAFGIMSDAVQGKVLFELNDRKIIFRLPLYPGTSKNRTAKQADQWVRSRWRGLLLTIKAKFESIEAGIETFEESFLAHIALPDGGTVYEHVAANIALTYRNREVRPLLEDHRNKEGSA